MIWTLWLTLLDLIWRSSLYPPYPTVVPLWEIRLLGLLDSALSVLKKFLESFYQYFYRCVYLPQLLPNVCNVCNTEHKRHQHFIMCELTFTLHQFVLVERSMFDLRLTVKRTLDVNNVLSLKGPCVECWENVTLLQHQIWLDDVTFSLSSLYSIWEHEISVM